MTTPKPTAPAEQMQTPDVEGAPDERGSTDEESSIWHGGSSSSMQQQGVCPVDVVGGSLQSMRENAFGQAWRYVSEEGIEHIAEGALRQMCDGDWELLEASQMDLFGEAWTCVAQRSAEDRVLIVVVTPERVGGVSDDIANSKVSVVQIGAS